MGKPVKIIDLARNMIRLAGFIPKKLKFRLWLKTREKLNEELLNNGSKIPTGHNKIITQEIQDEFETFILTLMN
jgi:FlaA1/EpsC-like NDP-sugar epimerase